MSHNQVNDLNDGEMEVYDNPDMTTESCEKWPDNGIFDSPTYEDITAYQLTSPQYLNTDEAMISN